jgi:DNA-binding response OmpR family regulator
VILTDSRQAPPLVDVPLPSPDAASEPEGTEPRRVLVAEDDPWHRSLLVELLAAAGYTVLQAADGRAAVELALRHLPHLILLDLALPHLSGLDVLVELGQHPLARAIPVLVVTAYGAIIPRVTAPQVVGVIPKPFDFVELLARVEQVLAK